MPDVVITVPKGLWSEWLSEGDLAHEGEQCDLGWLPDWEGEYEYGAHFGPGQRRPKIERGERVYIVAHGLLRGYAPFEYFDRAERFGGRPGGFALVRRGGAVAVTLADPDGGMEISQPIRGFQGIRYRWWEYEDEMPFPNWRTKGVS